MVDGLGMVVWFEFRNFVEGEFRVGCDDEIIIIDGCVVVEFDVVFFWVDVFCFLC